MMEKTDVGPGEGQAEESKADDSSSGKTTSSFVHALNNVFAVIQLNASMATERQEPEEFPEEELSEILAAVVRGKKLLGELSAVRPNTVEVPSFQGPGRIAVSPHLSPPSPVLATGGNKRILFIDDEIELAQLGQRLLVKKGYQVSFYTDSSEAFAAFAADPHCFDLVITDQIMPGLNGAELASRILQIRPDFPIVVCTGYSTGFSRWNFRDYGFCELLVKPYQPAELLSAIRSILGR